MQPFAHCPTERLRQVCGVLTDIDDTLTADGAIAPIALQALIDLRAAGVPVIAITGRPSGWSEPFARTWPLHAIVAENGAVMLSRVAGELQRSFTQDAATRAVNFERLQQCAQALLADIPGARLSADSPGRLTDIAVDHSEFAHLTPVQIAQVVALMQGHGLHATVSSIHINGWIGEHSKWTAAAWAVETTTGRPFVADDWLYVGDSTNDQLMFERISLSVGVANIERFVPHLKVLPAYVTQSERGEGFAEVARALLHARRGEDLFSVAY